jgi:hypothetical protein
MYREGLSSVVAVSCKRVRGDVVGGTDDTEVSGADVPDADVLGEARSRTMRLFLASDDIRLMLRSLLDVLGTERVKSFCPASLALAADCGSWTGVRT